MWSRLVHRRLQALVLAALAALVTVTACLGPLYQRDTEQALTRDSLARATPQESGISLVSTGEEAVDTDGLRGRIPDDLRRLTETGIGSTSVLISETAPNGVRPVGTLVAADEQCDHLVLSAGHCPTSAAEVAVSALDVSTYHYTVGSTVAVDESLDPTTAASVGTRPAKASLTIVGVYAPKAGDDYPAMPHVGNSGASANGLLSDDWVTAAPTFAGSTAPIWADRTFEVDWPLRKSSVGIDEMATLGPSVAAFSQTVDAGSSRTGVFLRVTSGLPQISAHVEHGRAQGRTTVTALAFQLVLLALVVLWLVLAAAVEQRRPEVALALLRGRGSRGAARLLVAELGTVTLLGVLLGGFLSLAVSSVIARVVLPVPTPLEVRGPFVLAWLGSAVVVVAVVSLAVRRVVREPVSSLLRQVPARGSGRAAGAAEIAVVAVCLTAVGAFVTGNLRGPLAVVAPTLLALAVGLLVARLLAPASAGIARHQLERGRVVAGLGLLQVARRPAIRRILVLATVATALLVFSTDALATGSRNRANAAEQQNGAVVVLTLDAAHVVDALAALDQADPHRRDLTVVASVAPNGDPDHPTVGVEPAAFPDLGRFPGQDPHALAWSLIAAPDVDPVTLDGSRLTGHVSFQHISLSGVGSGSGQATLSLRMDAADGRSTDVELGPVRAYRPGAAIDVAVPCTHVCQLTGLHIETTPALSASGSLSLTDLAVDGRPLTLGPAVDWLAGTGGEVEPQDVAGGLGADFDTAGDADASMTQRWVAPVLPALVTGHGSGDFEAPGLDGVQVPMTTVGRIPRVPGSAPGARVVDIANLVRAGPTSASNVTLEVWSDTTDPAVIDRATKALLDHGLRVQDTSTLADVRRGLDRSTPAWSLALAALVGGVSLLVAVLVLLIVASTTWRLRARDLAALRMSGVTARSIRRIGVVEQLPAVVVGVVAGTFCGVVGAHYALPSVALFDQPPAVSTLDFSTPWTVVATMALVGLVALTAVGTATGAWLARRARLETLREVL